MLQNLDCEKRTKKNSAMKELSKGERLRLAEHVNVNNEFAVNVVVNGSEKFEYCCYGIDANDKIIDSFFTFEGKTSSAFGAIVLAAGKRGQFNVKLASLPETVEKLIFVVCGGSGSVKSIPSGQVIFGTDKPLLRCPFSGSLLPDAPIASIVEIYRKDSVWRLRFSAESLQKEHSGFIREKLRKPSAVVRPSPTKPPVPPSVTSPPVPKPSAPARNTANLSQWNNTLSKGISFGYIWVVWLLPQIGRQPVPEGCYQALKGLFLRHLFWTLWFWVPFGAVLGWIHLALKSFRKRYLAYAILYSLVLLVPYSNGFWQVNILVWAVGLIHCYSTFRFTFRYMIESTDGKHFKLKVKEGKYNLNTIDYKTFVQEGWEIAALPILINRHFSGQFIDMPGFFRRLDPWMKDIYKKDAFSRKFDAVVVPNRTKFLKFFIAPLLLLCLLGGVWGVYTVSPPDVKETLVPQIQQRVYTFFGWDFYKIVQGTGSGVNRDEALRQAKLDALGNALGERLTRRETGKSGIITISDDEGDTNKAEQEAQEDYEKQVAGKISDVEILSESQSDGLFYITIKAKVLMNREEPAK
jgi:stress response protein SCP2